MTRDEMRQRLEAMPDRKDSQPAGNVRILKMSSLDLEFKVKPGPIDPVSIQPSVRPWVVTLY